MKNVTAIIAILFYYEDIFLFWKTNKEQGFLKSQVVLKKKKKFTLLNLFFFLTVEKQIDPEKNIYKSKESVLK